MTGRIKYGVSLTEEGLLNLFDGANGAGVSSLELPGTALDMPKLKELLKRFPKIRLRIGDLADRILCAEIPDASERLKMDFVEEIGRRLRLAESLKAESAMLPMDMARAFADAKYAQEMLKLLRQLAGRFFRSKVQMVFPVRLPLPDGETTGDYLKMLGVLMYPAQLELFLHVHEAGYVSSDWRESLSLLGFSTTAAHVVYEPATGNKISGKAVNFAAEFLARRQSEATVFLAPRGNNLSNFIASEIAQWHLIIDKEKENVETGS